MADDPIHPQQPPAPRPVLPLDPDAPLTAQLLADDAPPMPIAEPGVVPPAPFAQVYAPPPGPGAPLSMAMSPPPLPTGYYPPAAPAWPAAPPPPAAVGYRSAEVGGRAGRPGIITAIAVTGIICAAMGLITSVFSGCTGVMTMGFAIKQQRTTAYATSGTIPTTLPSYAAASAPPATTDGLRETDRAAVTEAIRTKAKHALSDNQEEQLDAFLAQHGRQILTPPAGGLAPRDVAKQITRTGQLSGGADFIVFADGPLCPLPGTLTLRDQNALFESEDQAVALRSVAKPGAGAAKEKSTAEILTTPPADPAADPTAADPSAIFTNPPLDPRQAAAVVARVRQMSNNYLNAPQASTLTALLRSPSSGNWIDNTPNLAGLTAQVSAAIVQNDGSITVNFKMGSLVLDPKGNLVGPVPPPVAATTQPSGATAPFAMPAMLAPVALPQASYTLAITAAGLSALIAIYLLIISIFALRQSAGGSRRMFLIYLAVKIPCAILAISAFAWTLNAIQTRHFLSGPLTTCLVFAVAGLLYPIGLLATLFTNRAAREYYRSGG